MMHCYYCEEPLSREDEEVNIKHPITSSDKKGIIYLAYNKCRDQARDILNKTKFRLGGAEIPWIQKNKDSSDQEKPQL